MLTLNNENHNQRFRLTGYIPEDICDRYRLVSNDYGGKAKWWKIVVMPHTIGAVIDHFISDIKSIKG